MYKQNINSKKIGHCFFFLSRVTSLNGYAVSSPLGKFSQLFIFPAQCNLVAPSDSFNIQRKDYPCEQNI